MMQPHPVAEPSTPVAARKTRDDSAYLDLVGDSSFPASDPPATWTWDIEPDPRADDVARP